MEAGGIWNLRFLFITCTPSIRVLGVKEGGLRLYELCSYPVLYLPFPLFPFTVLS